MAKYRYTGGGPDVDPASNVIVRPGDVWEFPEEPAFGVWEPVEADGSEKPSEALEPATPAVEPVASENPPTDASGSSSTPEA